MSLPFAYTKRSPDDPPIDPNDDPRQGYYPTNIIGSDDGAPPYVPAANLQASYSTPQADEPPAIDPQIIAAARQASVPAGTVPDSTPVVPIPDKPAETPVDPTANMVGQDTGGTGLTRPRRVETDEKGRPIANTAMTPGATDPSTGQPRINPATNQPYTRMDQLQDAATRLGKYEPQKAKGWWNRYAKPAIMGWAAGQSRSLNPGSGLGGALGGLLGTAINPKGQEEKWKTDEQAEVQSQIEQETEAQKNRLGIQKTQAEIKKLQAGPAPRPKRLIKQTNADGSYTYVPVDPETGRDANGNLVKGAAASSAKDITGWLHDTDGKAHYYANGKDTGRLDPGRDKVKLPDGTLVDPSQKYTADRQYGREDRATDIENQKAEDENARIQTNIDAANKEKTGIWAERAKTPRTVSKYVQNEAGDYVKQDVPNPIYDDLTRRGNALDDDIRRYETQKKPVVKAPPRPTVTGGKAKIPAKTVPAAQLKELGIK